MKKLFSLLIVFISIKCFGQVYQVLPQYGYEMKRVNATLVLLAPSDTVTNKTGIARIGTVLYSGNGTKWTPATSTDTTSLSNRINLKIDSLTKSNDTVYQWKNNVRTFAFKDIGISAIGVTTANGVSGTSSGGSTPNLTLSLGAITPTSVVSSGTVTGSSLIKSGGTASQILAADGSVITAGDFITITGGQISSTSGASGGGSSVNYYLNGGTNQGTFGGSTYYEFSKTAVIGTGADFNISADGYIASFITDAADPSLLKIPAGNWNLEFYFSSSSAGGSPSFYVELYKYDGTTFTSIASNSATPEGIDGGTAIDAYYTSLAVPETVLGINDRLAIRVYVNHSSKTITLHTQNGHLCEVITTFTSGLTALNGLQAQVQNFATGTSGTDFAISSSGSTHTFNLPDASAANRGVITTGTQTIAGAKTFSSNVTASITGNAGTATALQTARTIGTTTGDATSAGSTFNGTANNTNALTLATVNANVGSFGSATQSPTYTVNGKGLITAAANVTITPAVGSISGLGTGVATALGVNTGSAGAVVLYNGNAGTPSALIGTNITGTASLNINGTVGATTATTGAFTTATASTSVTTPLLIGGTTTTSPLTFKTTTGVGATGARHIFQVGNNGATEAMTILNSANVGIGTATPDSMLTVQQGLFAKRGVRLSGLPTGVGTKALRINATGQLSMADTTTAPSLTSTQIAFGSASNLLTGSSSLTFDPTDGGTFKVEGNNAIFYLYSSGLGNKAVFYNNDVPLSFGINTTNPIGALDVVGDVHSLGDIHLGSTNISSPFINYYSASKYVSIGDEAGDGHHTYLKVDDDNELITATKNVQFTAYGAGTASFDASGNISSSSDERLKTNIKSYKTGLKELLQLKPIQYKWNEISKMETEGTYAGFSAQNVKANIPLGTGENKEGYLSLQDRAIMATLVNAVKELNTKIENLEKQNAKLVKKLNKKPKKVILKY